MSGRVDIFVSYRHGSRHASWTRDVLVPALEKHGFSVLIDVRDFTPGGILVEEMEAASTRARVTVAIIDETYAHGGFVELERHLARRLIAVFRDQVDDLVAPQAASRVDLIGNDDPSPVIDAVRSLVKRVFILEANEDAEWVAGVVVPTLERTDVSTEHVGGLPAGAIWSDAVTRRLVNADHVVIVLSSAYLRDVHPRADSLVTTVEANERCHKTLPVRREADLDIPPKFKMQEIIDASRSELWDAALARLCAAVGVELPPPDGPPPCPYPGMRPYSENQSDLFFGREEEIASVLSGLRRHRFVAIIGPSASGKSSLALAGVASSVRERGLGAGRGWEVHTLRPGSDPMGALRAAVEHLRFGPTSSDDQATHPVLLVVDQLEEIFAPDIKDGPAFEAELTRLLDDSRFHLLVTIRADFYPNLMSGSLWSSITRSRVEVVPLSGPRLRAVIRAPARERGVVVAESLVERLAAETEGQPGLQPFLQETLVSLWDGLRHRLLTLEAYERSEARDGDQRSGLQEAIRREAESAVGEIEERCSDGERIVRSILLRLVQFGEGRPHTRRRLPEVALRSAAPTTKPSPSFSNDSWRGVFSPLKATRRGRCGSTSATRRSSSVGLIWPDGYATAKRARRRGAGCLVTRRNGRRDCRMDSPRQACSTASSSRRHNDGWPVPTPPNSASILSSTDMSPPARRRPVAVAVAGSWRPPRRSSASSSSSRFLP